MSVRVAGQVPDQVADHVEEAVDRHPALERWMRAGWAAKGVVYALMGALAVAVARADHSTSAGPEEDASPEGALSIVLRQPLGRALLGVLAGGLVLYSAWRLVSVALVRRNDEHPWLHRIGYLFSATFYALLAVTAARGALTGADPERSTLVERTSRALLESGPGRVLALVGGVVIVGVGLYFVRSALHRDHLDDLELGPCSRVERRAIEVSGALGLAGRAAVTVLVGVFVTGAAVTADPTDARGFDRALRHVATEPIGALAVLAAGVGLVLYGVFCLLSTPRRTLD